MHDAISEFRQFVRLAESLQRADSSTSPQNAFRAFVAEAKPLVISHLHCSLDEIARRARLVVQWMIPHDLLGTAGCAGDEDAYTDLLAWALRPDTHLATALSRQQAWLKQLGMAFAEDLRLPTIPRTQLATDDGRPDLILDYSAQGHVLVVEAKTGTEEHETPAGTPQTVSYGPAVRKKLRLPESVQVHVIFLTPNRRAAASPDATCSSFIDFVVALTSQLEDASIGERDRWAFGVLFTHLVNCAAPNQMDLAPLLQQVVDWSAKPGWHDDDAIAARLGALLQAKAVLLPEVNHA